MENIDRILAAYGITPASVHTITSRLSKVQTHQAAFALKRSSLHPERLDRWLMVVQGKHNFYREGVPPVYQTLQENFYVVDEGEVYYLMPWLERHRTDEPDHPYEMLFSTLGKIHASSSKRYPIDYEAYALAIRKQKKSSSRTGRSFWAWWSGLNPKRIWASCRCLSAPIIRIWSMCPPCWINGMTIMMRI